MFSFDNLPDLNYAQCPGVGKCAGDGGLETAKWRVDEQIGRCAADPVGGNYRGRNHGGGDRRGTHQTQSAGEQYSTTIRPPWRRLPNARRPNLPRAAKAETPGHWSIDCFVPTSELAEAAKCNLIIESILESLPAKQELFSRLHELLAAETIVASNTSTITIGKLAESMPSPERFCGLHFCHPVRERPLVEIVRGAKTGDETIAALVGSCQRHRQVARCRGRRSRVFGQPFAIAVSGRGPGIAHGRGFDRDDRKRRGRVRHGQGAVPPDG